MEENSNILQIIGNNLKQARLQKNFTQEQLSEKLNTSCKFVSMIERGCSGLSISNIVNLCNALDIEPNSLFNGIIDYDNKTDRYIVDSLSLLSDKDKDFIVNVIKYVLDRNK